VESHIFLYLFSFYNNTCLKKKSRKQKRRISIFYFSFINNCVETVEGSFKHFSLTLKKHDKILMVDYSLKQTGKMTGLNTEKVDNQDYCSFLRKKTI